MNIGGGSYGNIMLLITRVQYNKIALHKDAGLKLTAYEKIDCFVRVNRKDFCEDTTLYSTTTIEVCLFLAIIPCCP